MQPDTLSRAYARIDGRMITRVHLGRVLHLPLSQAAVRRSARDAWDRRAWGPTYMDRGTRPGKKVHNASRVAIVSWMAGAALVMHRVSLLHDSEWF